MDDKGHNVPYSEIDMIRELSMQPGAATVKAKKSVAFKEIEE